jgi:soluble lytic murein transglycosylase-like protein
VNNLAVSIYNNIISDIESRLNVRINIPLRSKAKPVTEAVSVQTANAAAKTPENNFQDILLSYLNGTTDKTELDSAIESAIVTASDKFGVDESLIRAVIKQESSYNPYAVSSAGAMGLMQLMPATAQSLGVADPYNVYQNIYGGTQYLYDMLLKFGGDEELALAAYNAGPGSVLKYGGIPPYEETENYVPSVLNYKNQYILEAYAKQK